MSFTCNIEGITYLSNANSTPCMTTRWHGNPAAPPQHLALPPCLLVGA